MEGFVIKSAKRTMLDHGNEEEECVSGIKKAAGETPMGQIAIRGQVAALSI